MRIIIVDDHVEKTASLINWLVDGCDVNRSDIDTANSAIEAKRLLKANDYDILILDLLLPVRIENEPSVDVSLELLKDIVIGRGLRRPRHVVGLTAFADLKDTSEEYFRDNTWAVFHYDPTSDDWLAAIKNCIAYQREQTAQTPLRQYKTDLCILTALAEPEEAAILALPWGWTAPSPIGGALFVRHGSFNCGGNTYTAVVAHAPRMGMVSSAIATGKLIEAFKPRFIAMTGICAGISGKSNFGDIILADQSWDYQSGKRVRASDTSSFQIDPHHIAVPNFVRSRFMQLQTQHEKWSGIKQRWPGDRPDTELKLLVGPVASGSAVIDDQQILNGVKEQQRKLLGVEMEIYGVYAAAAEAAAPKPTAFAIKSVCDFGDGTKGDSHQKYAAYTSAQALSLFCETYFSELQDLAGTA